MLYSVPYEFIKRKVDVRITDTIIEIFYNHNRIASHRRLYGQNILAAGQDKMEPDLQDPNSASTQNKHAITSGADYYRR